MEWGKNLTDLTLREIMAYQDYPRFDERRIFAAGKYQIIPTTMKDLLNRVPEKDRESLLDRKFDADLQEELGTMLILKKRPKLGAYLLGESDDRHGALKELSLEFASIPDPGTEKTSYPNTGNKSRHSVASVAKMLDSTRKDYKDEVDSAKAFNADIEYNRFPESSQGSTEFIKKEEPKLEDAAPDKEVAESAKKTEETVSSVEPKAPIKETTPAPETTAQKTKKAKFSTYNDPNDYSDYSFKEAFDLAKNRDKQKIFYWEGRPFTTVTAEELSAKSSKSTPTVEDKPAKEGKVEDYLKKAPEPLGWYEPAPGDMLGGEIFSMIPRYPVPDIMDKEEKPKTSNKSKVSDILKKTTEPDYDKMSFDEAFKAKRGKGEKEFTWRGKPYTTKYKEEM